jgi:hypothetical protein
VGDLEQLQLAYSCLKEEKIDENTFSVEQSNDHMLEEVYN